MWKKTRQHCTRLLMVLCLTGGVWQTAVAGGKSCGRCGGHHELKAELRLVRISREIDMPQYAPSKQEVFFPDKGAVCHPGYRCDAFHTLWRHCDGTLGCQSQTICGCRTLYGAKSTGHHAGCAARQPCATAALSVPLIKWEVVQRCQECREKAGRKATK